MKMTCPLPLGTPTKNIGTMLLENRRKWPAGRACAEKVDGKYRTRSWDELTGDVLRFSRFLGEMGIRPGDRVAFVTSNSYHRLVTELAVMAGGAVSVPIFAGYPGEFTAKLLEYAKVKALVAENAKLIAALPPGSLPGLVIDLKGRSGAGVFGLEDAIEKVTLPQDVRASLEREWAAIEPSTMSLIMFTSGTSGFPKGVQLSHFNLLSQQRALEILWKPEPGMKFLCYLPWHHSFGGLFERFFALHSGGCLAIDDSLGKNVDLLLANFAEIKPNVFFSVPKVYQEIMGKIAANPALEKVFFHPGLKFVFTAAAPLPGAISDLFKARKIPVVEGWGLTETSPCCTLTELSTERLPGVVGKPIPGVEVKLGEENEILVRGPNVMSGYLDRPEETARVLDKDGWFKTGDVGEITPAGLKIVSRKDRMFKLSNGEKVFPSQIEETVKAKCKFVKHAYIWGKGETQPLLMVTPNTEFFSSTGLQGEDDVCVHPKCAKELASCLGNCLQELNDQAGSGFERIKKAVLVMKEPTIESGELTPSFKLVPKAIEENYRPYTDLLSGDGKSEMSLKMVHDALVIQIRAPEPRAKTAAPAFRSHPLHYGLIGVGPIGSVIAASLRAAGLKVSAYCPFEERYRELKGKPVRISGAIKAEAALSEVYKSLDEFLDSKPDVIMLATKSSDSPEILQKIRDHGVRPETVFVSCQNGLDVEEQISSLFGKNHALRLVLNLGARVEKDGGVFVGFCYTNFLSQIDTGESVTADFIAEDLNLGGFKVELKKRYRDEVFKKVILNASLSPVCSILGVTMKAAMEDPNSSAIVRQLLEEAIRVAVAAGVQVPQGFINEAMDYLAKGGDHKPSMLLDIENKRRTENEDHGGKLLQVARSLGIAMPVTETIYHLMKGLEGKGKVQ